MRKFTTLLLLLVGLVASAQQVSVKWSLSDKENLGSSVMDGDTKYTSLLSTSYMNGTSISKVDALTGPNAAEGYEIKPYGTPFASYYVATKKSGKTSGHNIAVGVTPESGHKFKPTKISFDACKVGTDGGNFDVYVKPSGGSETLIAANQSPLRNRVGDGNPDGYSHHEYVVNDFIVDGKSFIVMIYIYNINGVDVENPKSIALRNVMVEGVVDEEIFTASHFVKSITFKNSLEETVDLLSLVKDMKNGDNARYSKKLYGDPKDWNIECNEGFTANVDYSNKTATVNIFNGDTKVFYFNVGFTVSTRTQKPAAKPLKRGLVSVSLSGAGMGTGNLVSWRLRENDGAGVKFKLYRGTSETSQTSAVNSGKFIEGKTNFKDASGSSISYYKLEVYDANDQLIETEVSGKTWANQSFTVSLGDAPKDPDHGATYYPNDASFCDMDGDGEYEIILKWSPDNEKDAASSGTTSSPYFDCVKLDGTRLWRIRLGDNFFTSAHTIQFIAWDFDGDGYGEFMCKTAPGTIDGEGNYVLLGDDKPDVNLLSGRGKQDHGPEYITVFDGTTGAELATIPYHTDFAKGQNYWGDSNQNRSERYLAALAYLDGYDSNPSPIFARGYYSGAFIAAYDWDGEELKERWVHRAYSATNGVVEYGDGSKKNLSQTVYGDGAHWISVADCDGDGKQEIVYGSSCIDHDGTTLYRTGLGHGDALHVSDFITDRPGLEVLMCHEHKPYGIDIRDAKTGEIIVHQTESGDTGRGLAAHFDSSQESAQFLSSARAEMYNMADGSVNGSKWAIGSSGAGINCRVYWDGDLYDEFFDKSIIAHWNPTNKSFDRYKFNNGNYLWGSLNNGSKNNPCVLGDLLGDWREEIVTWTGDAANGYSLYINATSYESEFGIPHLMDDPQYRVQVVNQNCCYNQPPHLSYDPAIKYAPAPTGVIEEGDYYLRNVTTGKYLQGGSYWGTRAIVGEHPAVEFTAALVKNDTYTFDSKISNGGESHFLTADELPYVDGAAGRFTVKKLSGTKYSITNGTSYLYANTDSAEVRLKNYTTTVYSSTKGVAWEFVTREQLIGEMTKSGREYPADATFLIKDPNLGRNDQRYSAWEWSADCTNKANNGDEKNYCAESYHSTFEFSQTLTEIPNGYYTLSAQGFYREDEGLADAPVLFANESASPFCKLDGNENSMKDASVSFLEGKYNIDPVSVLVTDGNLKVGVKNATSKSIWAIWDNFVLSYFGENDPVGITDVNAKELNSGEVYTMQGIKVGKPSTPGIYIVNGKKMIVK